MALRMQFERAGEHMNHDLSPDAERFLRERIGSMHHLDVLLQLHGHSTRWWSADALGSVLRLPARTVTEAVEQLAAENLLDRKVESDVMYRFDSSKRDVAALIDEVWPLRYTSRGMLARHLSG